MTIFSRKQTTVTRYGIMEKEAPCVGMWASLSSKTKAPDKNKKAK